MKEASLEYRSLVETLVALKRTHTALSEPMQSVLESLRAGWLTPGREILFRLELRELSLQSVLRRSRKLQRKWFTDLSVLEKSRWIRIFWHSPAKDDLPKVLGLSKRRLQQLLNPAKRVSQGNRS